jgi:AcrR family transcriptional regulator
MQGVADAVAVRAPSLYKRFPHKEALLGAVALRALTELRSRLVAAARRAEGAQALVAMAHAYRAFARRSPGLYGLLFATRAEGPDLLPARAQTVAPLLAALEPFCAPAQRLSAARLLTAYLHGFVSMELGGLFRMGGEVPQAFEFGVRTLVGALSGGPQQAG